MGKIENIQLISPASSIGSSANDGSYYPVGLLTLASAAKSVFPDTSIAIHDQYHGEIAIDDKADLVGISVPSSLCYENAITIAKGAKGKNKTVVFGGQYATHMAEQILRRQIAVDFIIRGRGEKPFTDIAAGKKSSDIPSLSWRKNGKIIHNPETELKGWRYDNYVPFPLNLLSSGIKRYWEEYGKKIDPNFEAVFVIFTHFGCLYKQRQVAADKKYCCFCSLDDTPTVRLAEDILNEIKMYVDSYTISKNAKIRLKCYGDNIGPQKKLIKSLADEIGKSSWWKDYNFSWTFYCQSSFLTEELAVLLGSIGTSDLFIGFDGINDKIQKRNGLGTNQRTHKRAIDICAKYGIRLQASSVVGLIDETPETLREQYQFFKELAKKEVLERINSGVIAVVPGSPSYQMLIEKEPWLKELDFFPIPEMQKLWIKHFCPKVSLSMLKDYAVKIDRLSPGPHGSIGYNKQEDMDE